jgi:hypothetical protein
MQQLLRVVLFCGLSVGQANRQSTKKQFFLHRRNLGVQRGANTLPIFFLPKKLFGYKDEEEQVKFRNIL